MFTFEVVLSTIVAILGIGESKKPQDEVHYRYIIKCRNCSIVQIENSPDSENMKASFFDFCAIHAFSKI